MKPFNLEEYLKDPSKKLVTRDGRTVKRIPCIDAKGGYPIVALVDYGSCDDVLAYTKDGKFYASDEPNVNDLFFAPEKHEGWINVYKWGDDYRYTGEVFSSKERALMSIKGCDCVATIKIDWEE